MSLDPSFNIENLNEMKSDFRELKSELLSGIKSDPEYDGEADVVLCSIDNLLEELDQIKSVNDIDLKKKVKVDALLFWVSRFLPSLAQDEDDAEELEDYFDDYDDEEGEDEDDSFLKKLEMDDKKDTKPKNDKKQ